MDNAPWGVGARRHIPVRVAPAPIYIDVNGCINI